MAAGEGIREAWIRVVGIPEAAAEGGALAGAYAAMRTAGTDRPAVYTTPSGDAPNIVRCHGLDPEGLRLAFTLSTALHWADGALPWRLREMINTVTSRANDCFY
ncbi:MAG TPA: carboxymuconolactone decarboxylase family protein [Myxococcota bacterium]|jgi:alkylhydroperoxidase family enzyme|nr:carboxymuconolactone decarboxylase family protein [Myxococcota bacterium]